MIIITYIIVKITILIDNTKTYAGYIHTLYMDNFGISFRVIYKILI